ncbi:unnamed protein product [Toxocara canis]|uniref:GAGA-binding transcriptional activator n=1 Tax=Toxocara canis TaxID=6265 RepID=A0A183UP43_TOXCA|nr:unnamed protein product [Toxocara canis]
MDAKNWGEHNLHHHLQRNFRLFSGTDAGVGFPAPTPPPPPPLSPLKATQASYQEHLYCCDGAHYLFQQIRPSSAVTAVNVMAKYPS